MAIINHKVYSSKQFSYEDKTFSTFSSDLCAIRDGDFWGQIYDDACDVGFTIESARTGKHAIFYLAEDETVFNSDNDIEMWVFYPIAESLRKNSSLHGVKVIVFND